MADALPACDHCGAPGTKRCGGCRAAAYCGRECQRAAWQRHKTACVAAPPPAVGVPVARLPAAGAPPRAGAPPPPPPAASAGGTQLWARGQPWPWAARGPRGLQPLYPGPPGWLDDPQRFVASLPGLPFPPFMVQVATQQYENDSRWSRLGPLYAAAPGGSKAPQPWAAHVAIFARAGMRLRSAAPPAQPVTFERVMAGGATFEQDPAWRATSPPPPRECDHCDAPAAAQCACGETFCSLLHLDAKCVTVLGKRDVRVG